ncbi:MAG: hypothetical protein Q7W16_08505 [Coriobacteriia bacterium]|nr:hypothetical protein [Coriobacteriia bacterium]
MNGRPSGVFGWIVLSVAVVALAMGAGYLYVMRSGALTRVDSLERAVVVFASHAEDGAEVAQVVALVSDDGRTVRLVDPRQSVTIPGTSFSELGDAYPFGGGKAVAAALAGEAAPGGYVDVPEAVWVAMLSRSAGGAGGAGGAGAGAGVRVVLPKAMDVFDGTRLVSFSEGTQSVVAADVPALLRGAAYLETAERMRVVTAVGEASIAALAGSGAAAATSAGGRVGSGGVAAASVRTDLTAEAYMRLITALASR